jgi:murein DD-endopeptidase MepM/ murein hydrolase activator NlpD
MKTRQQSIGSLQIRVPGAKTRRFNLKQNDIRIGRNPGNDLVIEHQSISRNHARVTYSDGKLLIEDLVSRNGIFISNNRIPNRTPVEIPSGTSLRLGDVHLTYRRSLPPYIFWGLLGLAACAAITILLFVAVSVVNLIRGQEKTQLGICDQPTMAVLAKGGVPFAALEDAPTAEAGVVIPTTIPVGPGTTAPSTQAVIIDTPLPGETQIAPPEATAPPSRPIISLAFMEIPFPYNGGNVDFGGTLQQFRAASQRSRSGGRINSFFDHYLPLYPASNDPSIPGGKEPAEPPIGKNILIFTGELSPLDNYSGHPALDYSTFVARQPTTPVFAVANGVVTSVGEHTASGALFVRVKHVVPDVGDFQTTYWHLHPDEHFEAMRSRVGQNITAGSRVGTMGNTGWSTGHHLHFEVRFDRNRDGIFSSSEVVDPYGYIPSLDYPVDPWLENAGLDSMYLWIHPLGVTAQVNDDGSGLVDTGGTGGAGFDDDEHTSLCAPPGALPPGGTVEISWSPDPPPTPNFTGTGHACALAVLDENGNPISEFSPPVAITIPFSEDDLDGVDPATLAIYWKLNGSNTWQPLSTEVDLEQGLASALTDRPGHCALMGKPTVDNAPPTTIIEASGDQSPSGQFYDRVTITLKSMDDTGVEKTEYSLDGGTTWLLYNGPFELEPGDVPPPPPEMAEEFFGGQPGLYLVLASATDLDGNIEDPPAYLQVGIDPSKDPDFNNDPGPPDSVSIPTETSTPTPSPTPSPTITATPTLFVCAPTLTIIQNAFCRTGPGTVYDVATGFTDGTVLEINGQNMNDAIKWWRVTIPNTTASCWVSDSLVDRPEDAVCVQELFDPPTPTPTPTVTPTFTSTVTPTSTATSKPPASTPTPTNTPIIIR